MLVDTHCHLGEYPDPAQIVRVAESSRMVVIAVTPNPAAFRLLSTRFVKHPHVRIAVGVHPLHAAQLSADDWTLFEQCLKETTYVGEVGLDFSEQGRNSRAQQETAFARVLEMSRRGKLLTVHSRAAEATVLKLLEHGEVGPVVFHWYSGSMPVLRRLIDRGDYCSFNTRMITSRHGREIIAAVPMKRALLESDGPFVRMANDRPATPGDLNLVVKYLSQVWNRDLISTTKQLEDNFKELLGTTRALKATITA